MFMILDGRPPDERRIGRSRVRAVREKGGEPARPGWSPRLGLDLAPPVAWPSALPSVSFTPSRRQPTAAAEDVRDRGVGREEEFFGRGGGVRPTRQRDDDEVGGFAHLKAARHVAKAQRL